LNAEQFVQRLIECRLLEQKQADEVLSTFGAQEVTIDAIKRELIQRELLTNWQIQRIEDGHRRGFYYGNWKVQYLVGSGTFARVYRAVNIKTGDVKAVKVLRSRYSADLDTQERFLREARTVMGLRHPNVVPIHEVDVEHGRTYMVMDFIEGQNVRDFVRVHGKLKLLTALNIARDVAAGLDYAAQKGITHRDLKLSNILLASTGRACLVDFGLAVVDKAMSDSQDFSPRSVDYAGLEKATGVGRDDKRSDMFFLGCVLYHMLSGRSPLLETRERIRRMSAERFRTIEPITNFVQLPHRVVIFVRHAMELDPAKRIQSPVEALRDLDNLITAVKTGDVAQYSDDLVEKDSATYAERTRKHSEGIGRTLMLIEPKIDVQNQLRDRLKKLGYRVLIISDPRRAIARFEDLDQAEKDPADCVIFSIANLGTTGWESFHRFTTLARSKKVPAILMVSQQQLDTLHHDILNAHRVLVQVPAKFREIRLALRGLLNIETADDVDDVA
jgi:serine/threonine protein kinase